ncbi:hypothetical protein LEP1GSC170_0137 [Leptospira interrogans serovar Bataviae str. HAI135]|nr:hypothetical protein LEP1GSC170_0137 [Leptospira interrogans serovar Bataviae str. HAI135]
MRSIPDYLTQDEIEELFESNKEDNLYELQETNVFSNYFILRA